MVDSSMVDQSVPLGISCFVAGLQVEIYQAT